MEMLFDAINMIVGFIPSVIQRVLMAIIPEPLHYACYNWLHIAVAF